MYRKCGITRKTVFTLHALRFTVTVKYLVSLERPTRAEWDHILQRIARPLKEQNPLDSSLSDSSEASERGPYDGSNKEENTAEKEFIRKQIIPFGLLELGL